MFKRTRFLLEEVKQKPKHILGLYKPNDHLLEFKIPYELRGEYLPRRKINPFRKKPLKVTYDQANFAQFTLPSERDFSLGSKISFTF